MKFFPAGLAVLLAASSVSAVEMPAFFSDNMVLQREAQVPLWGTGTPGEVVRVEFRVRSSPRRSMIPETGRSN